MPPPSKKLGSQDNNSCAAHCTVVAIAELTSNTTSNTDLTQGFAEKTLWPAIQFTVDPDTSPIIRATVKLLSEQKNSDPRLIVRKIKDLWPDRTAKLLCDEQQKNNVLRAYVPENLHDGMNALFSEMASSGTKQMVSLSSGFFYNCSYTMHGKGIPTNQNYTGMHNILVTTYGKEVYYYNPNEAQPDWKTTGDWKELKNQNGGNSAYVFNGVCVAIS